MSFREYLQENDWLPQGSAPKFAKAKKLSADKTQELIDRVKKNFGGSEHKVEPMNIIRTYPTMQGHEDFDQYTVTWVDDKTGKQSSTLYGISQTTNKITNKIPQYGGHKNKLVTENENQD